MMSIMLLCGASELLTAYDASYFWGPSNGNAVSGLSFNPSMSGLLEHDLNLRLSHFTGIFEGQGILTGLISARIGTKISAHLCFANYSKPACDVYDGSGDFIGTVEIPSSMNISGGFTYRIMSGLYAGLQYSQYMNSIAGEGGAVLNESLGLLSFGVNYTFKGFLLGLSLKNVKLYEPLEYEGSYPDMSAINFSVFRRFLKNDLNTGLIFTNVNGRDSGYQTGLSLEYRLMRMIYLRAAYIYGTQYISMAFKAGLGIKYGNFEFDYTFSPSEFGGQHYVSLGYGYDLPEKKKKWKPVNESERILVAVLDFEARDVEESESVIITDYIRGDMINSGYFKVLERSAINAILTEVNFQQTGCTDAACAVELGKILAVRKMVVGRISKVKGKFYITARLVDVETSEVQASVSVEATETLDGLPQHISSLVEQMIDKIRTKRSEQ